MATDRLTAAEARKMAGPTLEETVSTMMDDALKVVREAVLARARNARGSDFPDERDFANAVLALKEQTK